MNMFNRMAEIGWKKRLAIVLSFLWIAFAVVVSVNEPRDGLGAFVALGILPLSIPWGIAWVWWGFRKRQPRSASKPQGGEESSHINPNVDTVIAKNVSHNQPIARPHENKWLARAFAATSLVGFALYAGLLIRAVVIDGDIAYAFGGLLIPSVVAYAAISKHRAPTKTVTLVVATAFSSLIAIVGFDSWNEIVAAHKLAEVAQQHLNDVKLLPQESSTPVESSASAQTSRQLPPLTVSPLPPRSLSKSEKLEFFTTLMRESSERQMRIAKVRLAELNQLGLEAIWEPANLLSATGIRNGQRKIAAYQALVSKMEADYEAEVKWQDEKVLSVAGQKSLGEFRQGRADNQNDTKNIYQLQRASAGTSSELLSFFDQHVKQQTVAFQDRQFMFANRSDLERFQFLTRQLEDQEKQIADLQRSSLLRREKGIEKMKRVAGQY